MQQQINKKIRKNSGFHLIGKMERNFPISTYQIQALKIVTPKSNLAKNSNIITIAFTPLITNISSLTFYAKYLQYHF